MKPNKMEFLRVPFISRGGVDTVPEPGGASRASLLDKAAWRAVVKVAGDPPLRAVLWDGQVLEPAHGPARGNIIFRDRRALWRLALNPALHFGEEYARGGIDVEDNLVETLEAVYRAKRGKVPTALERLNPFPVHGSRNTRRRSRDNIHHHYDLGNDFYRLWLDQDLVYTCAYFANAAATLEDAQTAKMDYICRKLRLKPGEDVIEAGCGWGALALYMARYYGVNVRAFNISQQQVFYARTRARELGLDDRVQFIEDDYRNIKGHCDAFVSVGMLEHVGVKSFKTLGAVIDRTLSADGRGLIHAIGQDRRSPLSPWLRKRIFPGAYPPTLREAMGVFEPHGFSVIDVENLRLHYALTLEHWLTRFERHVDRISGMFDDFFVRNWRLYLSGSAASFRAGTLQLFQIVFTRPGKNDTPWTRSYLYDNEQGRGMHG